MTKGIEAPIRPDPLTEPAPTPRARRRLEIIDKLRGFVIVVMVLDHVRDFFHAYSLKFSTTDLAHTDVAIFATRWVTHLCAPTFVFLAGVSIYLQRANGKRGWPLARFLLTRGLWLIALEVTVVGFAFNFAEPFVFLQVIWAIGMSMILMAAFAWTSPWAVLGVGVIVLVGHDALTGINPGGLGAWQPLWKLMITGGLLGTDVPAYVGYAPIPWFGVMAIGVGAGRIFELAPQRRNRLLVAIGIGALACFAVLRSINLYGDVVPWAPQRDTTWTVLSFLKVSKYPPSLDYTLATLGVTLTLAPLVERIGGALGRLLHTFGRVPLFAYVVHLYMAHGLALLVGLAMGFPGSLFFGLFVHREHAAGAGWGFGLLGVYVVWIVVVLALWPLAAWFAGVKQRRRDWWLSYL